MHEELLADLNAASGLDWSRAAIGLRPRESPRRGIHMAAGRPGPGWLEAPPAHRLPTINISPGTRVPRCETQDTAVASLLAQFHTLTHPAPLPEATPAPIPIPFADRT
jgi:hypothetical protein